MKNFINTIKSNTIGTKGAVPFLLMTTVASTVIAVGLIVVVQGVMV